MNVAREQLSVALESAALLALAVEWETHNRNLFRGLMARPTFGLIDARGVLGRWLRGPRTMEFARATLLDHPWDVVVEVLKHEMAHQYVDEVLQRTDESAHGPAFQAVCAERGLDGRATGVPAGAAVTVLMMNSVEPIKSALLTTSSWHSGWTITLPSGYCLRKLSTCTGWNI